MRPSCVMGMIREMGAPMVAVACMVSNRALYRRDAAPMDNLAALFPLPLSDEFCCCNCCCAISAIWPGGRTSRPHAPRLMALISRFFALFEVLVVDGGLMWSKRASWGEKAPKSVINTASVRTVTITYFRDERHTALVS